jgi:triphosphatase
MVTAPRLAEEVELKFAIPESDAKTVQKHLALRRARGARAARKHLRSVYYDTPDLALRRRGIGLRVRRVDGGWVQTVKCDGGGTAARLECEHEIAGERPDLTCVKEAGLQDLFSEIDAPAQLRPVFATDIDRTAWQVRHRGAAIECALDVGEIRAGNKRQPIRELELELKGGTAAGLFEAAESLSRQLGLRLEWESKGQRGYALATGVAPTPPPRAKLAAAMTTRTAFATIVSGCVAQIAFYAPMVRRAGRVEDVHQMRVSVRKLRAALSTFRRAVADRKFGFEGDLRWLQDRLGAVRDWDVFGESAVEPVADASGDVAEVAEASAKQRDQAYGALCAALDSPRCTALWLAITRWLRSLERRGPTGGKLDWPIAKYAKRELRRRASKLDKRGRHIDRLEEAELHKLRIAGKKLRYAAEFFRDLFSKKRLKKTLAGMKGLQDLLGALNDARTARHLLERLQPKNGGRPALALAHGDGVVEGAVLMRARAERARMEREWQRYEKAGKPWA